MMIEMPMLIINSFLERPVGWEIGCDIYAALGSVSGIGSAINNAAIAYDRYKYTHLNELILNAIIVLKINDNLFLELFLVQSMDDLTATRQQSL